MLVHKVMSTVYFGIVNIVSTTIDGADKKAGFISMVILLIPSLYYILYLMGILAAYSIFYGLLYVVSSDELPSKYPQYGKFFSFMVTNEKD